MRKLAGLAWMGFALAAGGSPALAGEVVVAVRSAPAPGAKADDSWLTPRATSIFVHRLRLLGIVTLEERPAAPLPPDGELLREGVALIVSLSTSPADVTDAAGALRVVLDGVGAKKKERIEEKGTAGELDLLVERLAIRAARLAGVEPTATAISLVREPGYPFPVQRFLGRAEDRAARGEARQAAMMFDRAASIVKGTFVLEAIEGRDAAYGALAARGEATHSKSDLAASALERAEVALRRKDDAAALDALESFVKYTNARALRWALPAPIDPDHILIEGQNTWWLQPGPGSERLMLDPRSGTVLSRGPGMPGLVATTGDHFLVLGGRTLARFDERGEKRWSVRLPVEPRRERNRAVELSSGLLGVKAEDAVAWVEVSFGKVGQVADRVVPLASGVGGVLVLAQPKGDAPEPDVALLRPGKRTPAWRTAVKHPRGAEMTRDRVLLTNDEGLLLLRSHDGQPVRPVLPLSGTATILGADGRYATLLLANGELAMIDILAGEQTATLKGPGPGVASYTSSDGVAVLFATGDLIHYDRDGKALDRARVPGRPLGIAPGHPSTPGPVVVTTLGLYAFAEVTADTSTRRDLDVLLDLARVMARQKRVDDALHLATWVAVRSAGRVEEAERLRAELLGRREDAASKAGAAAALERAAIAADPTKPLPAFRLP